MGKHTNKYFIALSLVVSLTCSASMAATYCQVIIRGHVEARADSPRNYCVSVIRELREQAQDDCVDAGFTRARCELDTHCDSVGTGWIDPDWQGL